MPGDLDDYLSSSVDASPLPVPRKLDDSELSALFSRYFGSGELPPAPKPLPGRALGSIGPYEALEELGRGGMGVVYRARDKAAGRDVAVKLLLTPNASERALARFHREGEITARLRHSGIVRVFSAGTFAGLPYLALELVEGHQTLRDHWTQLSPRLLATALRDAARALGHAHDQGVVHRDIKPANILIDGTGKVRVTDFGLAMAQDQDRLTKTGGSVGTTLYMAPEQIRGNRDELSPATDVWALGLVLFEGLSGVHPFRSATYYETLARISKASLPNLRELRPDLPAGLDDICLRCLQLDQGARYADGNELADELNAWLDGQPISASGLRPGPRLARGPLPILALMLALIVGGAIAYGLSPVDAPTPPQRPDRTTAAIPEPPTHDDPTPEPDDPSPPPTSPLEPEPIPPTDPIPDHDPEFLGTEEALRGMARMGIVDAQYTLGMGMRLGRDSVQKNPPEARRWLARAANQGHTLAVMAFAEMLTNGEGGPVDKVGAQLVYARSWARNRHAGAALALIKASAEGGKPERRSALKIAIELYRDNQDVRALIWMRQSGLLDAELLEEGRKATADLPAESPAREALR